MNFDTKKAFIDNAISHGKAIEDGNHKLANKLHKDISKIYNIIKREERWDELKDMVEHSDESVRLWAATFLLHHNQDFALKALKGLEKSKKIFGLSASTTIDMWNKGMLQL